MPDSLFCTLLHTLERSNVSAIARALGVSEQCVSRCMESCIAAITGGIAAKAENLGELWKISDLVPSHPGLADWSYVAEGLTAPNPLLIASGNHILAGIFNGSERAVADAIGTDCGLPTATVAVLLSLTAPIVMTSVNNRVRGQAMCMRSFSNLLHREIPGIRSAVPPGVARLLWPQPKPAPNAPMLGLKAPSRETEFPPWAFPLALMAVTLGCYWALTHPLRRDVENASSAAGSASRMATVPLEDNLAAPDMTNSNLPELGPEADLLSVIQDPAAGLGAASRIEFYNLRFESGRATLQPKAIAAMNNIAKILGTYTNVRVKIWGRADDAGTPSEDLKLAHMRAERVKEDLMSKGISPDRLTTDALDDRGLSAADSSEPGVAIEITAK